MWSNNVVAGNSQVNVSIERREGGKSTIRASLSGVGGNIEPTLDCTEVEGVRMEGWRETSKLFPEFTRSEGAQNLVSLINDKKEFTNSMLPLAWERQEVTYEGTRTFRATTTF